MARAIWKGRISFGLVNIPVSLFSAEQRTDISFRMIDSRNKSRVRYERVNEATGEEVPWDAIVKGYEYDDDKYILLSEEEMENASPEATKTIDIEDFIDLEQIDYLYFDKPYYLEPGKSGEKSYILLSRALEEAGKAGIARVVIRTRQHLCAILSRDGHLVIDLLRFPQELRALDEFKKPDADSKRNRLSDREVKMALELIASMTVEWDPERYQDEYRDKLLEWINEKIAMGESASPEVHDEEVEDEPTKVVDLMDYLKRSVEARQKPSSDSSNGSKKSGEKKSSTKKPAKKAVKKTAKKAAKKKPARKAS